MSDIQRKAKKLFRNIIARMPIGFRRYMTRVKIRRMTAHLMSDEDLNRCLQSETAMAEVVAKYRARFPDRQQSSIS